MSKIRSQRELNDEMSREFAWRKKELHSLKSFVVREKDSALHAISVRSAIPLLYAHWEGFVKNVGGYYLQFVACQNLLNKELSHNFMAIAAGNVIRNATASGKAGIRLDLVEFFRDKGREKSNICWRGGINTKSNLSSSVLRNIIVSLGLDYSSFETKEKLLDEKLLKNRNKIAHGQHLLVSFDAYEFLHVEILSMMQDFYSQVEEAAVNEKYRIQEPQ